MTRKILMVLLLLTAAGRLALAQPVPDNADGRLWRLCKVWGYLKYYSPRTCQIAWDSLLKATVPGVKNAATNAEFNGQIQDMLDYVGQAPSNPAAFLWADTNLNLQLSWIDDTAFSAGVREFLDTFKSRAIHNDSMSCRMKFNDGSDPGYFSALDMRGDEIRIPIQLEQEADRFTVLFQYWNTFNYFAPYRNLADRNWDSVLLQAIPECAATATPKAFHFLLRKVHARIDDAHGIFYSPYITDSLFGNRPGIKLKRVENKDVVVLVDSSINGVAEGDILTKINGVPVENMFLVYRDYIAASNEATFYRDAYAYLLSAKETSRTYEFLNASGQPYSKVLLHNMTDEAYLALSKPLGPVWDTLCNGYGYVDLGQLTPAQVPQMYTALKDRPAIVFDVRTYPRNTVWPLAPYFFPHQSIAARFFYPLYLEAGRFLVGNDSLNMGVWNNPDPYPGQLFFLVNERTLSQGEYTVQYLGTAPGARVVGSQTAGADGNVNFLYLPDSISLMFTGYGTYYADWYQCQRNGLKIDDVVNPTIAGIRAGRDEVLESIVSCSAAYAGKTLSAAAVVRLYPNPAGNTLSLQLSTGRKGIADLAITDIAGKICYSSRLDMGACHQELDISSLPEGIYLLRLNTGEGGVQVVKFVKVQQ